MGRPKKKPGEERLEKTEARITAEEKIQLIEKARLAGLSEAEFIRRLVRGENVQPRQNAIDIQLLSEINRIGVNLNQIAKHHNAGRALPHSFEAVLAELHTALHKVSGAYDS